MNGFAPPSLTLIKHDPHFPHPTSVASAAAGYTVTHPASLASSASASRVDPLTAWSQHQQQELWKQIWNPSQLAQFKGSAKYAPIQDLPSSKLPAIEINVTYKR